MLGLGPARSRALDRARLAPAAGVHPAAAIEPAPQPAPGPAGQMAGLLRTLAAVPVRSRVLASAPPRLTGRAGVHPALAAAPARSREAALAAPLGESQWGLALGPAPSRTLASAPPGLTGRNGLHPAATVALAPPQKLVRARPVPGSRSVPDLGWAWSWAPGQPGRAARVDDHQAAADLARHRQLEAADQTDESRRGIAPTELAGPLEVPAVALAAEAAAWRAAAPVAEPAV